MFFIYKFKYVVEPRCVLNIGEECQGEMEGEEPTESPGGTVEPEPRRPRTTGKRKLGLHGQRGVRQKLLAPQHGLTPSDEELYNGWIPEHPGVADLRSKLSRGRQTMRLGRDVVTEQHGRRLNTIADYVDFSMCASGSAALVPPTESILFSKTWIIMAGPVPLSIEVSAGLEFFINFELMLCIMDKTLVLKLLPGVDPFVRIGGFVDVFFFKVGIQLTAYVMGVSLIPQALLGLQDGGGIRACLQMDMELRPLRIGTLVCHCVNDSFLTLAALHQCLSLWLHSSSASNSVPRASRCLVPKCACRSHAGAFTVTGQRHGELR